MKGKKTGGRTAGTPNKITATAKENLAAAFGDYTSSTLFKEDLMNCPPEKRLAIMIKIGEFIIPKMQSTTVDISSESKKTIENKLRELSQEDDE